MSRRKVEAQPPLTPRLIEAFVRGRAAQVLSPGDAQRLGAYLVDLHQRGGRLPAIGRGFRWSLIAERCGVEADRILAARGALAPLVQRLHDDLCRARARPARRPGRPRKAPRLFPVETPRQPRPVDPDGFRQAFAEQLQAHGQSASDLSRALAERGYKVWPATLADWASGLRTPRQATSFATLQAIERLWRLWPGDLTDHLPRLRGLRERDIDPDASPYEASLLKWHLPADFHQRDPAMQEEMRSWVDQVIIRGATDYRRYVARTLRHPFAVRFTDLAAWDDAAPSRTATRARPRAPLAPPALAAEMRALIAFKTSPLTQPGLVRSTLWAPETARLKAQHLSLVFGALSARPESPAAGRGVSIERLSFGLLVFPSLWEWYLEWRRVRRGTHNQWERDTLLTAGALTRATTGWMTQTPALADRLRPITGLVSSADIARARADWPGACERMRLFARERSRDLRRVMRVHNDRFEAVRVVLEASEPVAVYSRIADTILAERPCPRRHPREAADSTRGFLMIRLALHTGFRQRNLRELLFTPRGAPFRSAQRLEDLRRGELRWNASDRAWEVFAPPTAFKNARSSFFSGRPYWQRLPDLAGLYEEIDAWLRIHRPTLLRDAPDPGTFFVKSPRSKGDRVAYDRNAFHDAWWRLIQRYGVFNPYTGRGAVAGLLPHGPHNVRDVVATHILKQTGSFEQASYAIQDVPETIARHYGRFFPQDKVGIAAEILNRVWSQGQP